MKKITFLMTVHNGESFVEDSIESVLNQSEPDIALIIRNNGSTDQSGAICREYAARDSRVVYLENAVNYRLEDGATQRDRGWWPDFDSEYVSIVDHDDRLDREFAKTMYEAAKNSGAEMTLCGNSFLEFGTDREIDLRVPPDVLIDTPQLFSQYFSKIYGCLRTVWGILYQTDWYEAHYDVRKTLPNGLKLSTDTYYVLTLLKSCTKIKMVGKPLYRYYMRNGSGFHSAAPELSRIGEGTILWTAGLECLKHFHANDQQNQIFLYEVHWGHMLDILSLLCLTGKMNIAEKIAYIQEMLNDALLQNYRDNSFDMVFRDVMNTMKELIPSPEAAFYERASSDRKLPELSSFYLYRLYSAYQNRESDDRFSFMLLLSALCDPKNQFTFGLPLLKWDNFVPLSSGEMLLKTFSPDIQIRYLRDADKLKELLAGGTIEMYLEIEDQLVEAVDSENYEQACSLIEELNQEFPENEYAFYYRIYFADLLDDLLFAKKQVCMARVFWNGFWGNSEEIKALCDFIMDKPLPPKAKGVLRFQPSYLNIRYEDYETFTAFTGLLSSFSLPSLLCLSTARHLANQFEGGQDRECVIEQASAKAYTQSAGIGCFRTPFEGGATLYDSIRDLKGHLKEYKHLYQILSDEASKDTLLNLMLYRFWNDKSYLKRCASGERQYYLPDLLPYRKKDVFVDCGAFDGQTVKEYAEVYGDSYKKIYAYEPAPDNYRRVCENLKGMERVEPMNKGIADRTGTASFSTSLPAAANRLLPSGEMMVEIATLDGDIDEPVSFIKMDIEGMEQAAIRGAAWHIQNDHPRLAICLYHLVEDLWKIPELIEQLNPNQKFYMRYHLDGSIPEEIVFYANPL